MRIRHWFEAAYADDPTYRSQLTQKLLEHKRLPPYAQPEAPGHVVEFLKSGKHLCGVLIRKGRRHCRVLDQNGKEDYVDTERLIDISPPFVGTSLPRHEMLDALREVDRARDELAATIDPYELWEVVAPEGYDPVACHLQRQMMPKARMQTEPARHHGLGEEVYARVNHGLTRYTDLLMHQQVVGWLVDGQAPYAVEDLDAALLYTSSPRSAARDILRASTRYWLLKHIEAQVGEALSAVVLEAFQEGYRVLIEDTLSSAYCPSRSATRLVPGRRVQVKVKRASARANVLSLELLG